LPSLTIGDFAARPGVGVPTLRAWELRHGFPVPQRLASGHRRYRTSDVGRVEQVLRLRAGGLSLEAAIATVHASTAAAPRSIFTALRDQRPDLVPHILGGRAMLAISRAIEDECCARASRPLLVGGFQTERNYQRSEPRWRELARTAALTIVFAEPTRPAELPGPSAAAAAAAAATAAAEQQPTEGDVVRVRVPPNAPLRREWAVVCWADDAHAVLAGWQIPDVAEPAGRRFEAIWTVEPAVVAHAARIAVDLASSLVPAALAPSLPSAEDLDPVQTVRRAMALTSRIVAYLQAT